MASSASRIALAALLPLLTAATPAASPPRAPEVLEARVAAGVAARWGVPVDRVRLAWGRVPADVPAAETAPLELLGRGTNGWFAVVLRPDRDEALALRVRAGVMRETAVAARALPPGVALGDGEARLEERLVWGPPQPEVPVGAGWTTRRALAAGEPLSGPAVAAPTLIAAGEPITLVWERGAVRATRPGVALNAARAGGTVHVRAASGGRRFTGVATAPGTVTLVEGGRP
jgi:flagella basal body P-ring formation protein FlgA